MSSKRDRPTRLARVMMAALTLLTTSTLPLPGEDRWIILAFLGAAMVAGVLRWASSAWLAGALALLAGLGARLFDASFLRLETWCELAAVAAGALILWRASPPIPVFFLNLFLLVAKAFSPISSPPLPLLAVAVLLWMVALEIGYLPPTVKPEFKASLFAMLRLLVPVGSMVIFFSLLLPGRHEMESASGFTGAGILEAGAFGRVRLSPEPSFRAYFDEPVSLRSLYWRGDVLEENAGFTWRRLRPTPPPASPQPRLEILDPALTRAPGLELSASTEGQITSELKESLLFVPKMVEADPLVRSFVSDLDISSTPAALASLRQKLSQEGFTYSLRPGRIGRLQVGRFLKETRTGFCEHYAAASANVLRLAGIPTRVIAGFRGGSWNPWTRTLTVRALHAHAWIEAWDPATSRWLRFDPTDSVTQELSLRDAAEWNPQKWSWQDRLGKLWETWVETRPVLAYAALSFSVALALIGVILAVSLLSKERADPAHRLLEILENKVRFQPSLRRRTGEAPLSWMRRMATAQPAEARRWQTEAARFERLAYARPSSPEKLQPIASRLTARLKLRVFPRPLRQ